MTIIIKVPQPDTEWRLVLVTRNTVIHATYGRDATPADLERAGYVLRGGRQDLDCAISDLTAQVREAEDRAEKAEAHIKSLHDAEQATRRILDAVICEPTADAAARVHHNWVATRERAETAEADATLAQQQRATMYERAETAERERDEAYRDRDAAMRERDEARAELADAKNECAGAMRSAHAQYAETVRQRDTLRGELARLKAPVEGEPTDEEILDAWQHAGAGVTEAWLYRAGVAHERARQPAQDRATDEELERAYSVAYARAWESELSTPDRGERAGIRAVAAHVRGERCLVTRAVGMEADVSLDRHPRGLGERAYTLRVQCPTRPSAIAADVPASEVPARVARLLGEVSK